MIAGYAVGRDDPVHEEKEVTHRQRNREASQQPIAVAKDRIQSHKRDHQGDVLLAHHG